MLNPGTDTETEVTSGTKQQKPNLSPAPSALGFPSAAGLEPTPPHPVSLHRRAREESGAQLQGGWEQGARLSRYLGGPPTGPELRASGLGKNREQ